MRTQTRDAQFRAFYFAEAGRLRRLALFLTGDPHEADDLSQEAMLRTYRAWGRIRGAEAGPYCRRTLVNLHRNRIRRKVVERKHPPEPPPEVTRSDPQVVEAMRVADALKVLSPIRRATVVLRFYEDRTEADIARVLDRPLGTVKSDLHRALRQLRPLFEDSLKEAR